MSLRTTLLSASLLFVGAGMAMQPQQPVPAGAPVQYTQAELDQVDKDFEQFKSNAQIIADLRSELCLASSPSEQKELIEQRVSALEEENRQILAKLEPYVQNNPPLRAWFTLLKVLLQ